MVAPCRCQPGTTERAPLSPSYASTPYWWEDAPRRAGPDGAGTLPGSADVVVVGAGYTGLSAALELAGRGRHVVVLDRHRPGFGASGRNGGMVHPSVRHHMADELATPGGRARWEESVAAFEALAALAARMPVDCAWRRTGHVELAGHGRHRRLLESNVRALESLGEPARLVDGDELAAEVGSSRFDAGLVLERSGAVNPAALARGLEAMASAAGAQVRPGVGVVSVSAPSGAGRLVRTGAGDIRTGEVVVATGADPAGLSPVLSRRLLAVGSYIIATEPLDGSVAAELVPGGRMLFDTRNFLNYWRLSPDGTRLLFGGRTSFAPTSPDRARDQLYAAMLGVYPQLHGVRVERAWGGLVDLSRDRRPHVGRDPTTGAWFVAGYSGTGVALSTYLGSYLGRWICGEAGPSAYADEDGWRPVPRAARVGGALRVAGWWFRARDVTGR